MINGSEGRIQAISPSLPGHALLQVEIGDKHVRFDTAELVDGKGRVALTHAYASTLYASQGITVDRAFVLLSPNYHRNEAYVAASRAREGVELFVDRRAVDRDIKSGLPAPDRKAAIIDDSMRFQFLVHRLAREQMKARALDSEERPTDFCASPRRQVERNLEP